MSSAAVSEAFFEAKYRLNSDPWNFAASPYERSRYSAILDCLRPPSGGPPFERAFEPGCSVGILTAQLAAICRQVESIDISETAVAQAQRHCSHLPNVNIRHGALPAAIPEGTFDLIVFSEIGYYFSIPALESLARVLLRSLAPGGVFLAAHWLGDSSDHVLSGDQVHTSLNSIPGFRQTASQRHSEFRLDRWSKS